MATWVDFCRTERGKALDAKLIEKQLPLKITKAVSGAEKVSPTALPALTELPAPKQTLILADKLKTDDPAEVILPVMLKNKGLTESYRMYILAIYAEDPDLGEIIYMVCQTSGEDGEEIPKESLQPAFSIQWNYVIKVSDVSKVTVEVPEAGLLTETVADQKYAAKDQIYAGAEAPAGGEQTRLWIDTADGDTLKYYNGSQWTPLTTSGGGFTVSAETPENTDLLWIDTASSGVMKYHNGTGWVSVASVWG